MTERHKNERSTQHGDQETNKPSRPSQAEGDRATVEQDLGEQSGEKKPKRRSDEQRTDEPGRPSQAEGDRATVEQDLREKKR